MCATFVRIRVSVPMPARAVSDPQPLEYLQVPDNWTIRAELEVQVSTQAMRDRHDAAYQPRALGLDGVHAPAGEAKLHGLGFADGAGEPLRAAGAGHDAEIDLWLAEGGIVAGKNNVAGHGELAAAAERVARDRRDDRLAAIADAVERRDEIAAIGLDEGLLVHLLDVDAGGKRLLAAGDDDAADFRIGLEAVKRAVELLDEERIQRVQRMRPDERD